jgi:phage terminase large subunit-like protein
MQVSPGQGVTGPVCGRVFDNDQCGESGPHFCHPRADHVTGFFSDVLVHTKGTFARRAFNLASWQADEIIRPVFGWVHWSSEFGMYVRDTRIVWVELARKQGKSEMLAGLALYLLVADDEEGAEIYGAAKDRDQARKVFDVAKRMVELSPLLSKRLRIYNAGKRIVDEQTGSYYEVIAADAGGNLGHNPHGIVFDEVLTQPNGDLWDALRTAMGTRAQPLMLAATTPGDDPQSWCGKMHDEMVKIDEAPERAPHIFVYLRNTPIDADPFDESGWAHANPALGDFLSLEALRDEALEARNDPAKENSFRQYRLAQWVRQQFRWMPMHQWQECTGDVWATPNWGREKLKKKTAYFGMDLAAKFDLTAWCLLIPEGSIDDGSPVHALWRFWLPEDALPALDKHSASGTQWTDWARQGWLTVTEGNVVDYDRIYNDVAADATIFRLKAGDADQWSMAPVIQEVEKRAGVPEIVAYANTYSRMTPGMNEIMGFVKKRRLRHHGNPVAWSCFDSVEVRKAPYDPEQIRPHKPERESSGTRVDAVPAAAMAAAAWRRASVVQERPRQAFGF